jgi:hypothetical protein
MVNIMRDLGAIFDKTVSKTSKGGSYAMMGVSKKLQGKCSNCKMTGHRSADCRKPKTAEPQGTYQNAGGSGGGSGGAQALSKVKCYKCSQVGHFAHSCPTKKVSFQQAGMAETGSAYFVGLTNCEEVSISEKVPTIDLDLNFFDELGKESVWIEPDPELTFFAEDESSNLEVADWRGNDTDEDDSDDDMPAMIPGGWNNYSDDESDDGSLPALIPKNRNELDGESDDESDVVSSSSKTIWIYLKTLMTASWLQHVPYSESNSIRLPIRPC